MPSEPLTFPPIPLTSRSDIPSYSRPSSAASNASTVRSKFSPKPSHGQDKYLHYQASQNTITRNALSKRWSTRSHRRESQSSFQSHLMDYIGSPWGGRDPDGFVKRSRDEDCLKCMLKMPHTKCESHKYLRVGGGYRHSFWYIKALLEEIAFQREEELMRKRRLDAINEGNMRAVKTYIRTKSGRLIERIVYMTDDDYRAFRQAIAEGKDASEFLKKYLSKDEAKGLESFEKEEQIAIKTYIRTKSGRLIEKIVYVSKDEYDAIKKGTLDVNDVLKRHLKEGEKVEGWEAAKMRTITTKIRTKSGRIIEKTIMISEDDYQKLKAGGNLNDILGKYMDVDDGAKLEGWDEKEKPGMKVVKTYIRTKSGRLIEKIIMMTEEEFAEFQKSGGDPNFLKKFIKLEEGETIDRWEKASTVYAASDDEDLHKANAGDRIVDKDGNVYEIYVDPLTGQKYKKKIGNVNDDPSLMKGVVGGAGMREGIGKGKGETGAPKKAGAAKRDPSKITKEEILKRQNLKQGKRDANSESDYSYYSVVSAGGTRHVRRRKKNADGTRGKSASYHSSQDEDGEARRRRRRRERNHGPNSAHSYYSVVSEGGTRHVRRRKKNPDGTYGDSESYHSDDSAAFKAAAKAKGLAKGGKDGKGKGKKGNRAHGGSDSEHSYISEVSEGGTRRVKRRKRIRDEAGNIIGYGKEEEYVSGEDKKGKGGGRGDNKGHGSGSEHSYFSEVSAGGTRYKKKRKRIRDKDGNVIGYGEIEDHDTDLDNAKGKGIRPDRERRVSDFSDATTNSDIVREKMKNMTEEEKKAFLAEREKRKKEREEKRREKYGDEYEEIMEKRKNKKEAQEKEKAKKLIEEKLRMGKADDLMSDATTDSDIVAERMKNMTEEEKKAYLAERKLRKQEREAKRREKLGDKYDEVMNQYRKNKEEKQKEKEKEERKRKVQEDMEKFKSMVSYEKEKPSTRFKDTDKTDTREPGLPHDKWSKPVKSKEKTKPKDGNEADVESEPNEDDDTIDKKKKKKRSMSGSSGSSYEVIRDKDGNIIKKIKKDKDGNLWEFDVDQFGNIIGKRKKEKDGEKEKSPAEEPKKEEAKKMADDGYFEVGEDGKIRLKAGKKKIDLDNISKEDLLKLGIDPNLSKAEIMRLLKEKFGDDVDITFRGDKIGTKRYDQCSNPDTDELADDSDLDLDTLKGVKRMRVIMRRGGQALLDHMKNVLELSRLTDNEDPVEKDASVDFLAAYRLVDPNKLETYVKAFIVEDADDMDGYINYRACRLAMRNVPNVTSVTEQQMNYVMTALDVDKLTPITFRMFSVVCSLAERVTQMDQFCRDLLEISSIIDIERKLALYRAMFYCNASSDRDPNYIKLEALKIELMAGGLNWNQQEFVLSKLMPNDFFEISFLDYLCYIPLFLSFHDNICENPLDLSNTKYTQSMRRRASIQRDMNPLGFPLDKHSIFIENREALELMVEKPVVSDQKEGLNKYSKLPNIAGSSYPATPRHSARRRRSDAE